MKWGYYLLCLSVLVFQNNAMALSFMAKDPRSLAMGGTMVASSSYGNSVLYNPALLSAPNGAKGTFWSVASLALRIADPDNLSQPIDDFTTQKYFENFNASLANLNQSSTLSELDQSRQQVVKTGNTLIDNLTTLSDKAIELQASVAAFVADTDRQWPMAISLNVWGSFGVVGEVVDSDLQQMRQTLDAVDRLDVLGIRIPDPTTDFVSNLQGRGILLQELALALSHTLFFGDTSVSYGVTPKYVRVNTYDYYFAATDIDSAEVSLNSGLKTTHNFNMDAGLAMAFTEQWKVGVAIKNIIEQQYTTVLANTIDLKPAVRAGLAFHSGKNVISLDYDLLREQALGIGGASQYLGVGYEFQGHVTQLRLGYRHNFPDSDVSVASLGLGWEFWRARLDVAVVGNANEISVASQLNVIY